MSEDAVFPADIIGFGETVDLMPYVRDALAACRYRHDFSPKEVAELVVQVARGRYVPVDVLDRVEDRRLDSLTGPVIKWVQSEYRIAQVAELIEIGLRSHIELHYFADTGACACAVEMGKRWLKLDDLVRLPLPGCDVYRCMCSYRTFSRKEAERTYPERLGGPS